MKNRGLITGGTGYIGSKLVAALVASGWDVHLIVRPNSSLSILEGFSSQLIMHIHDGTMPSMISIMESAKPDVVFHLASDISTDESVGNIINMLDSNLNFSIQLVEAISRCGVENIINTETFWQKSNKSNLYDPTCFYAATKVAFRTVLEYYVKYRSVNATSLMLYDVYGNDDCRTKFLTGVRDSLVNNETFSATLGEQVVYFTHIDDVVNAYVHAAALLLEKKFDGLETYSICSLTHFRLREVIEQTETQLGFCLPINWGGRQYRQNEIMEPWVGKRLPGWYPSVNLIDGLVDFFRDKRNVCLK